MLKELPPDARPREKMLMRGPAALADAELVALLLRTGVRGESVLQLSQRLLDHFDGLPGLLNAFKGILEAQSQFTLPALSPLVYNAAIIVGATVNPSSGSTILPGWSRISCGTSIPACA
mgnify:CR=1 FL=1